MTKIADSQPTRLGLYAPTQRRGRTPLPDLAPLAANLWLYPSSYELRLVLVRAQVQFYHKRMILGVQNRRVFWVRGVLKPSYQKARGDVTKCVLK